MKFTDKDQTKVTNSSLNFEQLFISLITNDGIKYDDFHKNPNNYKELLEGKAGVYHFFSKSQSKATSLYIGQTADLHKRLREHQQEKYPTGLPIKIAKEFGIETEKVIKFLCDSFVYIQYIEVNGENNNRLDLESYCKSRLNPKYTDI
jgi:excinuclease UvrABC nuclease subunit